MQCLLIIAHDGAFVPTEELVAEIVRWTRNAESRGIRVHGNPLRPAIEATTVRVRDGRVTRSRRPFSRSQEQMCAYELVECETVEEAVEIAAQHPMAAVATIEVRPVWSGLAGG